MVILVHKFDAATTRALGYARSVRPRELTAIGFEGVDVESWRRLAPDVPLTILDKKQKGSATVKDFLRAKQKTTEEARFLTLVIPELLEGLGLLEIARHPQLHRLKASLLRMPDIQVMDVPILKSELEASRVDVHEPVRNYVLVLVSALHNPTLQAIEYAETLAPTDLRAVSFGLDPAESERLGDEWLQRKIPIPLEIQASPFRDIGRSLADYVRRFRADGSERVVTVVIPEFVVTKTRHQFLHGQTAFLVKRHLLFERGVVVASVPYHLREP